MGNTLNNKKANGLALLPFLVFIVVYMGAGLVYQSKGVDMAFYQFPSVTAMFLAVLVAFIMFKGSINEKFDTFAKGAANVDVLTMLIIYILAGAFATVAAEMGGRDATVNLGLSLVPVQFLAAGLFVIAAFMGTATGTSMGTISAITPIAVGVAEKGGLNMMVVLGAVIGGAMFGDNLSMISDTTIAATRSQHCEMRDKFRVNFLTALPAALVTIVVLLIVGRDRYRDRRPVLQLHQGYSLSAGSDPGSGRHERVPGADHRHLRCRYRGYRHWRYRSGRFRSGCLQRLLRHERGLLPDPAVRRYV